MALGLCLHSGGDFRTAVLGAVNYGRDADSIATVPGAVCGALGGLDAVPTEWVRAVEKASRMDLNAVADELADAAREILGHDRDLAEARSAMLGRLLPAPS